ncbi:MAG: F0F1 ATP synthase subunit gamma [Rhodospirillaceae bacterium]|nr:F0F1 ATP synthase subunit gamma [Rhodospirillaceae bacterium]
MASLKDLRNRISTVKSTQKITSAMKMVAASRLRRAQEQAERSRPFAMRMERMLASLARSAAVAGQGPRLMVGTGHDQVHLLVVVTSDRGLCGGFNASITRETRRQIRTLQQQGKTVRLMIVGRKGRDNLRRDYNSLIFHTITDLGGRIDFSLADRISDRLLAAFDAGEFDVCTVIYNRFKSAISQVVTVQQLIPLPPVEPAEGEGAVAADGGKAVYEFEPDEEAILRELLPRNLSVQVFKALLESSASEQGARMTAMDNATRNAGEMINGLTLLYNRTRQAAITKELIEIISGAEAL